MDSPPQPLWEQLSEEDDPALWTAVLTAVAEDAALVREPRRRSPLYARIGACAHWVRPHQTRWSAGGGFVWPAGYGDGEGFSGVTGLPGFDWSTLLQFDPDLLCWKTPVDTPTKRHQSVRVAIPTRTTRHRQAAIHALWSTGTLDPRAKRTVFYGFRCLHGAWTLAAHLLR